MSIIITVVQGKQNDLCEISLISHDSGGRNIQNMQHHIQFRTIPLYYIMGLLNSYSNVARSSYWEIRFPRLQ